jgi:asparagine synthase (glutamine-hydrolysing)
MSELESSLHLFQTPLYRGGEGTWKKSFIDAVSDCKGKLTWDPAAILSILSFGYVCGDRTLLNEVKRRPWLSKILEDGECSLETIPKHGRLWKRCDEIADELLRLLCDEATKVCQGRQEIYILLSGGLDSRIVAGVLAKLCKEGKIDAKPVAVTWGLEGSRDAVYGRMLAGILGFEWIYLRMGPEDVINNLDKMSISIASLVSPLHLHCMHWFKNVSKDALVLGASYGDSVGRAEFSGRKVLELDYLNPSPVCRLMHRKVLSCAYEGLEKDLKSLRGRSPGQPKYVICEHEKQGHYMRNMMAQAMSSIGCYCSTYQMFTHPKTYSYMWSIHPALRNDSPYAALLEKMEPRLARMPWARTNRALSGRTIGAKPGLRKHYHEYESWIRGPLLEKFSQYVDPQWLAETRLFNDDRIQNLTEMVRSGKSPYGFRTYERWSWLASLRGMAEHLDSLGKSVALGSAAVDKPQNMPILVPWTKRNLARRILSRSVLAYNLARQCLKPLRRILKRVRRSILKYQAVWKYPPEGRTYRDHHEY